MKGRDWFIQIDRALDRVIDACAPYAVAAAFVFSVLGIARCLADALAMGW